ncbi:MAG: class I SAM-dependent methyltransferase [Hyphomonadaceae bacterium]
MRQDVTTLENFYTSPLGRAAAKTLSDRMQALWGNCVDEQILGIGFATPLLDRIGPDAEIKVAAMPAAQGALTWAPTASGVSTVLCDEMQLPFRDGMFSRILVMHGLEESHAPDALLRELWRIMAPEGRLIVIASNRLGLWARSEATPFGHGRPWTRGQLARALNEAMFQTTAWTHGLHMPPTGWGPVLALHEGWEKVGETLSAVMGGVVLIEATKRLYVTPRGEKISFSPIKTVRATKGLAQRAQKRGR